MIAQCGLECLTTWLATRISRSPCAGDDGNATIIGEIPYKGSERFPSMACTTMPPQCANILSVTTKLLTITGVRKKLPTTPLVSYRGLVLSVG